MDIGGIVKRDKETLTKYLLSLELKLKKLYGDTYAKAMQLQSVREAIERGDMGFTWKGNPEAEKKLDKLLDNLANNSFTGIAEGINRSYTQGQTTAEKAVESQYKDSPNKEQINDICKEATEQHRINVTKSYTTATQANGGQRLSSRVWGLNEQSKTELEIAIQNAIIEGKSADEASRDIRKYLNNPDALFRRVRDKETGELVLSEAAKNYHPGRGVYRSAYKNALRMARTEINAAYLRAEIESYQSNPLVTGYEIKLSGNHTTTLPNGKVVHLTDICDKLAGKYPKTFMFTGWHPQCRCYIVPITIKDKEANKLIDDKGTITPDDTQGKQIDELPNNMQNWLEDNQERIDNAKQLPPFIEQNKELIDPKVEEPKKLTPLEIAEERHKARTPEQIEAIKKAWEEREKQLDTYYDNIRKVVCETEETRRKLKHEELDVFDAKGNTVLHKKGGKSSVGCTQTDISMMKDCVATHNHPGGLQFAENTWGRIGNSFSMEDIGLAIVSNLAEIRAVTPVYTFSLKRPANGWGVSYSEFTKGYKRLEKSVIKEIGQLINANKLSVEVSTATFYHLLTKRIAKIYGFDYSKKRSISK